MIHVLSRSTIQGKHIFMKCHRNRFNARTNDPASRSHQPLGLCRDPVHNNSWGARQGRRSEALGTSWIACGGGGNGSIAGDQAHPKPDRGIESQKPAPRNRLLINLFSWNISGKPVQDALKAIEASTTQMQRTDMIVGFQSSPAPTPGGARPQSTPNTHSSSIEMTFSSGEGTEYFVQRASSSA